MEVTDRFVVEDNGVLLALSGERNGNLKRLERETGVRVHSRGNEITIVGGGDKVAMARRVLDGLFPMARSGRFLTSDDVAKAVGVARGNDGGDVHEVMSDTILVGSRARPIAPKTLAQKQYVDAIRDNDIVFGVGPAGTGKTYLAMALAVRELMEKRVKRIVLTRPAVEAGEKLGFLPGSLEDKVSPYLRPLYDALFDMMDAEKAEQLVERNLIEIAPIAFMRGRTLNDAFVILDEAQNTTSEQMQMFLTRLGFESKAVITGDVTQVDLPYGRRSGLAEAMAILKGIPGIEFRHFSDVDVCRHPLVQKVIRAYERQRQRESGDLPPQAGDPTP
ncbi:MAG: PhoH family protein [Deltaproteobacteria bacterium]|nr:PhoH family protein [Deltaproteobacteria bacterium]